MASHGETTTGGWPADGWDGWFGLPWGLRLAPQVLTQPVNPGWSFGNVIVNHANSSAPEVEHEVVSRHSYGRQLNRLSDAVCALADALPATAFDTRVAAFRALAAEIAEIKRENRRTRLEQLRDELVQLRRDDPQAWAALVASPAG